MSYDISSLLSKSSYRVVLAESKELAGKLSDLILQKEPEYALEISPAFSSSRKIGPIRIKNKNRLWDILIKTKQAQAEGKAMLLKHMEDMDLRHYDLRFPASLSNGQKLRASMLYETLNGRNKFLVNDYEVYAPSNGYIFTKWFANKNSGDLIWITALKEEDIFDKLGENNINYENFSFFRISEDKVEQCEAPKPVKKKEPQASAAKEEQAVLRRAQKENVSEKLFNKNTNPNNDEAERLLKEGEKYDRFFLISNPGEFDDPKKAMRLYEDAAMLGSLDAQLRLGYIHSEGLRTGEANHAWALYWYTMAVCNDYYSVFDTSLKFAWDYLRNIFQQVPESEKYIRKYAGDKADDVIHRIKHDIADLEYMRKFMDKHHNKF